MPARLDRHIRVVAAVISHEDRYLITQRRDEAVLAGLWEFPGGRVEDGEDDVSALVRELDERLGVSVTVGEKVAERHNAYDHYDVTLALYSVTIEPGRHPQPLRVRDLRWVRSDELEQYRFPAADEKTMDALLGLRRS